MADLPTLANVAEIVGALTVVGGVGFAVVQLRQQERSRRDAAAFELVRSFQNPAFHPAFELLNDLPDGLTADAIAARGPEVRDAVVAVGFNCETLGVMVFHRVVPLDVLDQLMGQFIRVSWRKLSPYAEARRRQFGHANSFEWYQRLAEQLDAHPAAGKAAGAHVAHRGWAP